MRRVLREASRYYRSVSLCSLTLVAACALPSSTAVLPVIPIQAAQQCADLVEQLPANVRVEHAQWVDNHPGLPAYCRIAGTIGSILRPANEQTSGTFTGPLIGFETRLPADKWNGRFLMAGCGAYCGQVLPDRKGYANSINFALARGYAATTTDSGHRSASTDTSWAFNNPEAEHLYAHAWVPLATEVSHRIVQLFYQRSASYTYFSGCSNGGRTALKVAQLYPELFDGIASGCPTVSLTDAAGIQGVFLDRTLVDDRGRLILGADKIPMLSQAVKDRCDHQDGLVDGLVSDPWSCDFDPETLACTGHEDAAAIGCLTPDEIGVIKALYRGAVDSKGQSLHYGMSYGSEVYWARTLVGASADGKHYLSDFGSEFLRYLGLKPDPGPQYHSRQFDLDTDIPLLQEQGQLFNVTEPDLSGLRRAGGKLLLYHGLADSLIMPEQSISFYQGVVAEAGSENSVNDFFRLFLIPGADHCWGETGHAPDLFDPLRVLEEWVEQGHEPDRIEAIQHAEIASAHGVGPVVRTRPLCPYPRRAVYSGKGSEFTSTSYVCQLPE